MAIVSDPRRTLRDNPVAVFREPDATEPKTLLQLLADVRHAYHAAGDEAERDRSILLACRGEQPINGRGTVLDQITRQCDEVVTGIHHMKVPRRSVDTQAVPNENGVRRAR